MAGRTPSKARTSGRSRRTRLTRRGRLFVGAGIGFLIAALIAGNRVALLAGLVVLLLAILAFATVRARRLNLAASRTFSPAVVEVGSTAHAAIVIENLSNKSSAASLWYDTLPWYPGYTLPEYLPPLGPHRERFSHPRVRANLGYPIEPTRRGVFAIGPIEVETGDPFSLVTGTVILAGTANLVVTPRISELPGSGLSLDSGEGSTSVVTRSSSGSDDDLMTREYRRGDALRRVHWRASARHGELMVRQEEPRNRPEARLVLDTRFDGYPDAAFERPRPDDLDPESESFEWVVGFVASTGLHLARAGYAVTVIETAGASIGRVDDGTTEFAESLAALTLVRDEHVGGGSLAPESGQSPLIAAVTDPTPATIERITRLRRPYERGVVVLVGSRGDSDQFEKAGWSCVRVTIDDAPEAVWPQVVAGVRGGVRVD